MQGAGVAHGFSNSCFLLKILQLLHVLVPYAPLLFCSLDPLLPEGTFGNTICTTLTLNFNGRF